MIFFEKIFGLQMNSKFEFLQDYFKKIFIIAVNNFRITHYAL